MKPADRGWSNLTNVDVGLDLFGARAGNRDTARSPLLQQKLRRLDDGIGVKAYAHRTAVERVSDRYQGHPLMVRHVSAHDRYSLALRNARRRIVQSLIPAESAEAAGGKEPRKILRGGFRIHHRRQRRRVGSDDGILS